MSRSLESAYLGKYLGTGVVNTIIGFAVILLLMWHGAPPVWANVGGYAVGLLLGFVFSKRLVLRSMGHWSAEGLRYLLAFGFCFLLNLVVLDRALHAFPAHEAVAQIPASISYTVTMYALLRLFVHPISLTPLH